MTIDKKFIISGCAGVLCMLALGTEANAENILSRFGCGTGCIVRQRQLSKVVHMPKGFRRVLIETQDFVLTKSGYRPCGVPDRCDGNVRRVWIVADCINSPRVNLRAYKSDGSDGYWLDAFNPSGGRADSTAEGRAYSHWAALCQWKVLG